MRALVVSVCCTTGTPGHRSCEAGERVPWGGRDDRPRKTQVKKKIVTLCGPAERPQTSRRALAPHPFLSGERVDRGSRRILANLEVARA